MTGKVVSHMKNLLKEKLLRGEKAMGVWQMTSSVDNSEILAHSGFDAVLIDGEHGSMDIETAGHMITAIRTTKTTPLLRVPWNDIQLIKRGLDTGAHGVMIPMINTREEAERAVSYCKYPPVGVRGVGAGRASLWGSGGGDPTYAATANDEILVIIQIEHYLAVENVYDILSVPGIDVAFIGPGDLSQSMGIPGQMSHPKVREASKRVIDACRKNNVVPAIMSWPGGIQDHLDQGFQLLFGGMDGAILYTGAKNVWNEFCKTTGRS